MAKEIKVTSQFAVPPAQFWELLQRSDTLVYVTKGVACPRKGEKFPEKWEVGVPYYTPAFKGQYNFIFTLIDEDEMQMETTEEGGPIISWQHFMFVEKTDDGATTYTDEVVLDAGWLTRPLSWWVRWYYHNRHRRWHKLLKDPTLARLT